MQVFIESCTSILRNLPLFFLEFALVFGTRLSRGEKRLGGKLGPKIIKNRVPQLHKKHFFQDRTIEKMEFSRFYLPVSFGGALGWVSLCQPIV